MEKLDGGELIVRALLRENVTHLFTLSGGHLLPLYNACLKKNIRLIDTRHEQAAAHMAEGWSICSRKMGVCAVTAGPGLTDAVTAVANAYQSNTPMLIIGGRSSIKNYDTGTLQDMDQMALMKPITKWAKICHDTKRLPEYVATAFRHGLSGRPGPVYLEVPLDVMARKVDEDEAVFPDNYRTDYRSSGDPAAISKAAEMLQYAKRPLVLAGSGCLWSSAGEALKSFCERTKIPVITRNAGRGVLPDSHRAALSGSQPELMSVIVQADIILVLGTRFNFTLGFGKIIQPHVKIIQVDIEPEEIGFNRGADVGIAGDITNVLNHLTYVMPENSKTDWVDTAREMVRYAKNNARLTYNLDTIPIHERRLVEDIKDVAGEEAIYVCDGGEIMLWGSDIFPAERPASVMTTGPLGCLGVGLPFAMAAKIAEPKRTVILLSGDGTFGLNGMEFDTAIRHNIPVVCVVGNDQAWGMIKHTQEMQYGSSNVCCSDLGPVRYDKVVEALGGHGEYVEVPEDITPALIRAIKSGKPACVNVICDPSVSHPVSIMMGQSDIF